MIASAPTRPTAWLLPPAASATAVREALPLTGKPWKKPAARLAAPRATISWSGSTSRPYLRAKVRESADVSASVMKAMPSAASVRRPDVGQVEGG